MVRSELPAHASRDATISERAERPPERNLTRRQQEVLSCLARGHLNREIAQQLGLSEGTVKIHTAAILRVSGPQPHAGGHCRTRFARKRRTIALTPVLPDTNGDTRLAGTDRGGLRL